MSFKKTLIKNILVSGGYNYLSQAIAFLSSIIISRLLTPESYGFVGIITIFTGFLSIFSDSGISLAVIRSNFLYTYYKSVDTLALLVGTMLCLITCALAFPIALFFRNMELVFPMIVMSTTFIFKSMTLVRGALIVKDMKFGTSGLITLKTTVFTVFGTILLAFFGAGYWSLVIPQTLSSFVMLFLQERHLKFGFHFYSWPHVKVSFQHTKKTIGNLMGFNIVNYWSRNSDNLLVGRLYGTSDLGIYNRAYNLLTFPLALITGLIGTVLFPSLNRIKENPDTVRAEYLFILRLIGFASFPVSFVLLLFSNRLVYLLWGDAWMGVANLLPYFGLLLLSQSLLSTLGNILVLVKREEVLRISGWISAVIIVSSIVFGATISLVAIAQFYSLAFIVLVLPFHLFYVYINVLKFPASKMLSFWGPNILFSLGIWLACYYHNDLVKIVLLVAFFTVMLFNARTEISKIFLLLNNNVKLFQNNSNP
ncbi:MAG: oligosaccharide flippase family protein [Chitinophagaceae bacterium]|nr:oligosaccharide flippase family protein [Chitinophagaceae bacterium]